MSYYSITVDGVIDTDAAWEYKHPSPLARKIKGRVAFGRGVEVTPATLPPAPSIRDRAEDASVES